MHCMHVDAHSAESHYIDVDSGVDMSRCSAFGHIFKNNQIFCTLQPCGA